ncbi:MAG: hypothetical protein HY047_05400 [Acidobacteria bacterium]|nr:hypothetical protein [Acidobacteriota bacterium]
MTPATRRIFPIALLLVLLGAYQGSLLGVGAYSFQDEVRYKSAVNALVDFSHGEVRNGIVEIARMGGRPGETLVKMIPAALQFVPHAFGITPANPRSLLVPTACNVLASLAIVFLLYRIARLVFDGDATIALTVAAVYSLLMNTSVYVRHLFPYDWSLCLAMYALWLALSREVTPRLAVGVGMLGAAVVTIYPGYYPMSCILALVLFGRARHASGTRAAMRMIGAVALGVALVLAPTEMLSRLGGHSYVLESGGLTTTITLGSFDEGWLFLPRYLRDVEGYTGAVLAVGFIVYAARLGVSLRRGRALRPIDWLVLPAVGAWTWQAVCAYHLHWMVVYGRLIHPLLLFLALALGDALLSTRRGTLRSAACAAAVVVALLSWAPSAAAYRRVAYPADVAYRIGVDTRRVAERDRPCELEPWGLLYQYTSPPPLNAATNAPYSSASNYFLVNFCFGLPKPAPFTPIPAPRDARLLYEAPHFLTFPAYGFEGCRSEERRELAARRYTVRAYRTADRAATAGDR